MEQAELGVPSTPRRQLFAPAVRSLAPRLSLRRRLWARVERGAFYFWVAVLLLLVVIAFVGEAITPYPYTAQDPVARLLPPLATSSRGLHVLGTDPLGRDLLSNVIVGTRLALFIGVSATALAMLIGVSIGMLAGFYGGTTDRLAMRLVEAQTAMPMFLVNILFLAVIGPSIQNIILLLPASAWTNFARLMRAETLRLRTTLFVEAAVATGCTNPGILLSHLLPNLAPRIVVLCVIEVGHLMLSEASLSFLGVGVQPPDVTWGLLIARGRPYLAVAPWLAIVPGVVLGLVVYAINTLSRRYAATVGNAA